jgi:two-component system sensor kinase FixL
MADRQSATALRSVAPSRSPLPRLEDVLENTTDAVVLLDAQGCFTYLNRNAMAALRGGPELVGTPVHELFHAERGTREWELMRDAGRDRKAVHFDFFATAFHVWFSVHIYPIPSGQQIFFRDITIERAAHEALSESEETLRLALEGAGDAAWDWNLVTQAYRVSGRLVDRLGHGSARFDGGIEQIARIIHRDDLPGVREALVDHLAGRKPDFRAEYRVRTRDGEWRWNLDRGRVVSRDPHTNRATRIVGTSSDITEAKQIEQLHKDRADLLELAQRGAAAGAWDMDLGTGITTLSPRAVELLGLPGDHPGTIKVPEFAALIHPDDRKPAEQALADAILLDTALSHEYRVQLPDGSIRWLHTLAGPASTDESGRKLRRVGLLFDVHQRRLNADALRASEERLRLALDAAGDGAWDWDLVTNQVVRSPRLIRRLGYEPDILDADAAALLPYLHPDDLPGTMAALRDHLAGRSDAYLTEYRLRNATGQWVWIRDRGLVVARDETGRATRIVGTGSDITAKKHAAEELTRLQGELIHLSRLSAMGAMASTLAHELNQPLTAATNYARGIRHLAQRWQADPAQRWQADPALLHEAIDGVEQSAERAGEIVRRLRDYVTRGEVDRRPVGIRDIIEDAAKLALVDAAALGVTYRFDIAEGIRRVLADRVQIQQVMMNLLRNAVEAMQDVPAPRTLVVTVSKAFRQMVEVRVADTGSGISPEVMDQLFTPFVSTKQQSMGVGLSICRTIIEAHEGQIWTETPDEGGAAMCFTLPQA